jgi:hypothetical protein
MFILATKTDKMIVRRETLIDIKDIIERHTKDDPSITDVIINYQLKESDRPKNFLNIQIK